MTGFAHVAIDGPAGSGKTTVARALARRLGVLYLDTGAMYRAVALGALRAGADPNDETAVIELARRRPVRAVPDSAATAGFRIYAGEEELGEELYGNDVSRAVSAVSAHPRVRELLVERQRAIAQNGAVVMAGRDIGTVVLPDAPVKVFLTASLDARVERRRAELAARGTQVEAAELRRQILERDRLDAGRAVAPLQAAPDAVEIDASELSVEAVVDAIAGLLERSASAR
jgi:cytidylate kinase